MLEGLVPICVDFYGIIKKNIINWGIDLNVTTLSILILLKATYMPKNI